MSKSKKKKYMKTVKISKFEKSYIISQIDVHDITGISPQYFTASEVDERLTMLIEKSDRNKKIYEEIINKIK